MDKQEFNKIVQEKLDRFSEPQGFGEAIMKHNIELLLSEFADRIRGDSYEFIAELLSSDIHWKYKHYVLLIHINNTRLERGRKPLTEAKKDSKAKKFFKVAKYICKENMYQNKACKRVGVSARDYTRFRDEQCASKKPDDAMNDNEYLLYKIKQYY